MNAAGPWRDDVENIPKDGNSVFAFVLHPFYPARNPMPTSVRYEEELDWWLAEGLGNIRLSHVVAWAVINPPEANHDSE